MDVNNHRSTSEVMLALANEHPHERISVQEMIEGLGDRSFGFLLLLFSLPCIVAPPGLSSLPAIILIIFGAQMALQFKTPWLPQTISKRSIARGDLISVMARAAPIMRRVERWCRPRYEFLIGPLGERLLGVLVIILSLVIMLPGPGTNGPPGLAIAFLSIAIIERDGLLVFLGVAGAMAATYLAVLGLLLFVETILPALWNYASAAFGM